MDNIDNDPSLSEPLVLPRKKGDAARGRVKALAQITYLPKNVRVVGTTKCLRSPPP